MRGYYGSKYSPGEPVKFIIEKAKGKAFEGYSVYGTNGQQKQKIVFNGFVFPGGEALATNKNGYFDMKLLPKGKLHVVFRDAMVGPDPITLYGVFTKGN